MSRVMLVDDEESILKSLKRILRLAPCTFGGKSFTLEVETYSSPLEALEAARHDDYDLFVSDYRLLDLQFVARHDFGGNLLDRQHLASPADETGTGCERQVNQR